MAVASGLIGRLMLRIVVRPTVFVVSSTTYFDLDRSKRVIWLNPEARLAWNTGDSEMRKYGAYSHQVEECNSLMHLERVVGNLLRQVT